MFDDDPGPWISEPSMWFYKHFTKLKTEIANAETGNDIQQLLRSSFLPAEHETAFFEDVQAVFVDYGAQFQRHDIDTVTDEYLLEVLQQ